jgi:hypothetical protein
MWIIVENRRITRTREEKYIMTEFDEDCRATEFRAICSLKFNIVTKITCENGGK